MSLSVVFNGDIRLSKYGLFCPFLDKPSTFLQMPPPRPATADDVDKALANWPTLDDLPDNLRQNVQVIQSNFNLADHIRDIILRNPYVPPTGDRCPINDLPNELLAYIFGLGTFDEDEDDEDDMYQENLDELEDDSEDEDEDESKGAEFVLPFQVLVSHVLYALENSR